MTPEQRFVEIETLLKHTASLQADQQEQLQAITQKMYAISQETDKQLDAVRSLIIIGRTCLDSIQRMGERHDADYKKLQEAQAATDEKLNILIETVDRIIRHREGS